MKLPFYKFIQYLLLIISSIFLIYVVYKSQFVWEGKKTDYFKIYYIISISFFSISLILLLINKIFTTYFVVIFSSILISLYSIEIYLLNYDPLKINIKSKIYFEKTGKKFDSRSKFEIYKDLKKNETSSTLAFFPNYFIKNSGYDLFPMSGISLTNTIYCNENGYYSNYDSDRYGFNNPDNVWDHDEVDYLILGDSYGHGACVNSPNDIGSQIRKISNKKVINLSYGGNGPLISYAALREYGPKKIKNILFFFYEGNDHQDLNKEIENKILLKYLNDDNFSQDLKDKQASIDSQLNYILNNIENNVIFKVEKKDIFVNFVKLVNFRIKLNSYLPSKYQNAPYDINNFSNLILGKLVKYAQNKKANLFLVYLPSFDRFSSKKYDKNVYEKFKFELKKNELNLIDISELVFDKSSDPLNFFPFRMSRHYNALGYQKVSEEIMKFISNH
tara:strand:+ start:162 stop:1499 length:1338 start_codon:yes stop_codon:yes gene_type:complete